MDEKIIGWIADYCAGRLGEGERRALREWIGASPEHRKAFEECLRVVKACRMLGGEERICDEEAWKALCRKWRRRKQRRLVAIATSAAAAVVLAVGICAAVWLRGQREEGAEAVARILPGGTKATLVLADGSQVDLTRRDLEQVVEQGVSIKNDTLVGLQYEELAVKIEQPIFHTVRVPVGGEYHFTLSDGTKVWLNSASELTFPVNFVGGKREIFLKGEAYIEAERDESRPFVVHAAGVAVSVLGTKFNVSAYQGDRRVVATLLEGSVRVDCGEARHLLSPSEQAIADREERTIAVREVDPRVYVAWIKGIFEYENMPLGEIAVQLSRWYNVDFAFSSPSLEGRRFTGVARKYNLLDEVLAIIEKTTNVRFVVRGRTVEVREVAR